MDAEALKSAYVALMLALGCAWSSGISPWLTAFVLGLMLRFQADPGQIGNLQFLTSPWALVPLGILTAVEFVADKFPRWDVKWHLRNGRFRIGGALILAWLAGGAGGFPLDVRIVVVLLGGVAALLIHAARTSAHMAMHEAGTQNFAVPLSGLVEEFLACSILFPLGVGSPGLTTMMIGVTSMAAALILALTWKDAKKVIMDILLGAEPPPPAKLPAGSVEETEKS